MIVTVKTPGFNFIPPRERCFNFSLSKGIKVKSLKQLKQLKELNV